jgi:hypothetical protein
MRRLLILCLVFALGCLALASATNLEVNGGVLQVFDLGDELEPASQLRERSTSTLMEVTSTTVASRGSFPSEESPEGVGATSP